MFAFGTRSLANLAGVHPDLQKVAHRALAVTRIDFGVIEGRRTLDRQRQLIAQGASQTMHSRHLTGHAIDIMAYVGGQGRWDAGLYYGIAGAFIQAATELNVPMIWGGAWTRIDGSTRSPDEMISAYVASRRAAGRRPFIDSGHYELLRDRYP
jgi:peptidoglycan L-alanyl-D-glutamate endopeptidase CwlK